MNSTFVGYCKPLLNRRFMLQLCLSAPIQLLVGVNAKTKVHQGTQHEKNPQIRSSVHKFYHWKTQLHNALSHSSQLAQLIQFCLTSRSMKHIKLRSILDDVNQIPYCNHHAKSDEFAHYCICKKRPYLLWKKCKYLLTVAFKI